MIKFFNVILRILYPKKCPLCERIVSDATKEFCAGCEAGLTIINEPVCVVCGRPVKKDEVRCRDCEKYKHEFIGGRITFSYEQVSSSVYRFKYMNRPEYAWGYGKEIAYRQRDWIKIINPDAIIPVPLHKKRLIKRGYNQAEELAKAVSYYSNIPVRNDVVLRVKNTSPLKFSDREGRRNNMKNAFIVRENVVKLNTVVLVDDIYTTGSTLDAVAGILKAHGIENIYFLTITAAGT